MKYYQLVLAALALLSVGGCVQRGPERGPGDARRIADGRLVPDRWSEAFTAIDRKGWQRLSSDALYVRQPIKLQETPTRSMSRHWEQAWYRFWPSGHVLECIRATTESDSSPPTAADGDNFTKSDYRITSVGRYRVRGDQLEMEFIGYHEGGATFVREKAKLNPDGSFTVINNGLLPASADLTCRPHPVQGMRRYADW